MEEDEGPTFEDLQIDDTLNDLERVAKYSRSNIALQRSGRCETFIIFLNPANHNFPPNRLVHTKMLSETAHAYRLVISSHYFCSVFSSPHFACSETSLILSTVWKILAK